MHDAREACRALLRFTDGHDFADYEEDEMLRSAVERQLEILGEALHRAGRLDESLREQVVELRRIVVLRNRIIHGYDSVDEEIVWDIVQSKVPPLERLLGTLLDERAS